MDLPHRAVALQAQALRVSLSACPRKIGIFLMSVLPIIGCVWAYTLRSSTNLAKRPTAFEHVYISIYIYASQIFIYVHISAYMYICARVQGPPGGRGFPPPPGARDLISYIYIDIYIYINMNLHADNCSIFIYIYTCIYHAYIYNT